MNAWPWLGFPESRPVLSGALRSRPLFVRPSQPPSRLLFSDPTDGIWVSKAKAFGVPFCWSFAHLANPHVAVVGMTGSGKSFFVKSFLTRSNLVWGTHALILDWSGEYASWVKQSGGHVIRLGEASLNLLDLGGMTPSQRTRQVVEALALLTDLGQFARERQWVRFAIEQCYAMRKFSKRPPTLKDVSAWLKAKSRRASAWDKREMENAVLLLRPLVIGGSDFFAKPSSFALEKLLEAGLVCVDLTALPSESFRSLAGLSLLQFVAEKMRACGPGEGRRLKWWVVLDEAWKICREDGDPVAIVREGRKYAFGLVIASQNPMDVHSAIFSNVGSLFMFRTAFSDSLDYLQKTLGFSDAVRRRIGLLPVGCCAVNLQWAGFSQGDAFFLERVDGEALLEWVSLEVKSVAFSFEKKKFLSELQKLGVSATRALELEAWLSGKSNAVDAGSWVAKLSDVGLADDAVRRHLKQCGFSDEQVSDSFAASFASFLPKSARLVEVDVRP